MTRSLPEQDERVNTGPVKFGNDWTGVFIRGDNAFQYTQSLKSLIDHAECNISDHETAMSAVMCKGLLSILESSFEQTPTAISDQEDK